MEGLRDLLRGLAPTQTNRQKFKSVLDKLDYQRNRAKSIKREPKSIEEKKVKLEKELCFVVGPEGRRPNRRRKKTRTTPQGVLPEQETAKMMQRPHPGYINCLLQAEFDKLRATSRLGHGDDLAAIAVDGEGGSA